jgi:hypothetical protein
MFFDTALPQLFCDRAVERSIHRVTDRPDAAATFFAQLRSATAVVLTSTPVIVFQYKNVETTYPAHHRHRPVDPRRAAV